MDLLNRQDVQNIIRDFNLRFSNRLHENDSTSVEIMVQKMAQLGNDNPIIFYKNQQTEFEGLDKSDFVMVIMTNFQKKMLLEFGQKGVSIDGTHGTNPYDFQLYTLLVTDELDNGVPTAYLISNRQHEEVFAIFYREIERVIGQKIQTNLFMSDGADAFYNAWLKINPPAKRKLLCWWHVNKNWVTNASRLIKNDEKRDLVLKVLRSIKDELVESKFCSELNTFLQRLEEDPETKEFFLYFRGHYLDNKESWAMCYRKHTHMHTNMHLESLHKTLKYEYLNGRHCTRLDKTIDALLRYTRDKKFERLIKLNRPKGTKKIKQIQKSHKEAEKCTIAIAPLQSTENRMWTAGKYVIEEITTRPPCCPQSCKECNICVHNFYCTCVHNTIKFVICKHIHALIRNIKGIDVDVVCEEGGIEDDEYIIDTIEQVTDTEMTVSSVEAANLEGIADLVENEQLTKHGHPSFFCNKDKNLTAKNMNEDLKAKAHVLLGLVTTTQIPDDEGLQVMKYLDKAIQLYTANSNKDSFTPSQKVSGLKKLDVQKFFSTKKKKGINNNKGALPYVSSIAGNMIREEMNMDAEEQLNIVDASNSIAAVHTYASQTLPINNKK